jgi:hypothetical protein
MNSSRPWGKSPPKSIAQKLNVITMLVLGILLFFVLTFIAALIAGVGTLTATVITVATMAVLLLSRRRSSGHDIRS